MKKLIYSLVFVLIVHLTFNIDNCEGQWVQMSNGIPATNNVYAFAALGTNIFAGTFENGVLLSANNGTNWTQTSVTVEITSFTTLGNNIFAGTYTNSSVFLSTNNGINWAQTALMNVPVLSLATLGTNIFAGSDGNGVYRTTNNGANWTQTTLNNKSVLSLTTLGTNIFAGTGYPDGIYISTNNGTSWTQSGLNNQDITSLATIGNNIFAGTQNGVFISNNNGTNWTQTAMINREITSLAASGNNIFAGTVVPPNSTGVFISTNNGANWIEKNQGFSTIPTIFALFVANNYIFAGTGGQSVWRRSYTEIGVQNISTEIPAGFSLSQNYPNPFNQTSIINFQCAIKSNVVLKIYDVRGKDVMTLVNEMLQPGTYQIRFDAPSLASGVYFYKISAGDFSETKRLMLVK